MAIGERIHYFRTKLGMTQKYVGTEIGFDEKSADVRMAQYEKETRVPKDNLVASLASLFDVSTDALKVPDIDTRIGLMHTLFTLEDRCGLKVTSDENGKPLLYLDPTRYKDNSELNNMLLDWLDKSNDLKNGTITQDQYDYWRYHYPVINDTTHTHYEKVIPQALSDLLIAGLKDSSEGK